jgi:hypothetical protein
MSSECCIPQAGGRRVVRTGKLYHGKRGVNRLAKKTGADQFSAVLGWQLYCRPWLAAFSGGGSATATPTSTPNYEN